MPKRRLKRKRRKNDQPSVLDLFCGAGGLSLGFQAAGYKIVGGIDVDRDSVASFKRNIRDAVGLNANIRKVNPADLLTQFDPIDVLVGGPSCQGFSTSGGLSRNTGRNLHDDRNDLFVEYLRIVKGIQPSWIVFENVPGLLLYHHGYVARKIIRALRRIGYFVVPIILLAADYGVPQLRRRLFFIGNRTGSKIPLPAPTHGESNLWAGFSLPFKYLSRLGHGSGASNKSYINFDEACSDLPSLGEGESIDGLPYPSPALSAYQRLMRRGSRRIWQHSAFDLSDSDRLAANLLQPGENWRSIPEELRPDRFRRIRPYDATTLMKRLQGDKPAYTITTKFNEATTGAFIHPRNNRTLSIREAARLQSFPDSFRFEGNLVSVRRQLGNAVPPLLSQAIAESIMPHISEELSCWATAPARATVEVDPSEVLDDLRLHGARKYTKDYGAEEDKELQLAL